MESNRAEPPPDEVLSTGRPPGPAERWARSLLARSGFRAAMGAGLLALVLVAWFVVSSRDEPAASAGKQTAAPVSAPGLRPAPLRGPPEFRSPWKVRGDVSIRRGPHGSTLTFHAVNGGSAAAWPSNIRVDARFLDRQGLIYQAHCLGIRPTAHGPSVVEGGVAPGAEVLVRCTDITHYGGSPARLAAWTVHVTAVPCHAEAGRQPGV